jgi:hypothetical protein
VEQLVCFAQTVGDTAQSIDVFVRELGIADALVNVVCNIGVVGGAQACNIFDAYLDAVLCSLIREACEHDVDACESAEEV